jgi:shikimate dehydrogenase
VTRAAVLGRPVAHSLSPVLHTAAYAALGLRDWSYTAVDVGTDDLPGFLDGLDHSWAGLSLTMPLKRAVVPLLDQISPLAGALGVVNTVTFGVPDDADPDWVDPRVRTRRGDNTDVGGIVEAVRPVLPPCPGGLVVLGAGATAASALAAGVRLGLTGATVCARSPERAREAVELGHRLGIEVVPSSLRDSAAALEDARVVVSTLPAGAADGIALPAVVAPGAVLLDVVYDPWPTVLASRWQAAGGVVVPGVEMLVQQAVEQVLLMTGRRPDAAALRAALPAGRGSRTGS